MASVEFTLNSFVGCVVFLPPPDRLTPGLESLVVEFHVFGRDAFCDNFQPDLGGESQSTLSAVFQQRRERPQQDHVGNLQVSQ